MNSLGKYLKIHEADFVQCTMYYALIGMDILVQLMK
jgi:hypothetical protein